MSAELFEFLINNASKKQWNIEYISVKDLEMAKGTLTFKATYPIDDLSEILESADFNTAYNFDGDIYIRKDQDTLFKVMMPSVEEMEKKLEVAFDTEQIKAEIKRLNHRLNQIENHGHTASISVADLISRCNNHPLNIYIDDSSDPEPEYPIYRANERGLAVSEWGHRDVDKWSMAEDGTNQCLHITVKRLHI